MSSNLDLVRSIVADWNAGTTVARIGRTRRSSTVYLDEGSVPDTRTTGVVRMNERCREMPDALHETRHEPTAVRELDPDRVLVLARFTGRGKTSGPKLGKLGEVATVFHLNAGKVTSLISYAKAANAFADLSLTPDE